MLRPLFAALFYFAFWAFAAHAADLSDDTIRKSLIGQWIVPKDSSDYSDFNSHMVETFRSDGTYTAATFATDDCQKILQQIDAKWSLQNGVLTSVYPDGRGARDQILDISDDKMTLHSLDDGTNYTRTRADECGKPIS